MEHTETDDILNLVLIKFCPASALLSLSLFSRKNCGDENKAESEYAFAAKVYLHESPVWSDMWGAARELIPGGKDKDVLIVYLPKGTGQPRMHADAFIGKYLASGVQDVSND